MCTYIHTYVYTHTHTDIHVSVHKNTIMFANLAAGRRRFRPNNSRDPPYSHVSNSTLEETLPEDSFTYCFKGCIPLEYGVIPYYSRMELQVCKAVPTSKCENPKHQPHARICKF